MINPMPLFGTSEGDWAAYRMARDKLFAMFPNIGSENRARGLVGLSYRVMPEKKQ